MNGVLRPKSIKTLLLNKFMNIPSYKHYTNAAVPNEQKHQFLRAFANWLAEWKVQQFLIVRSFNSQNRLRTP